MSTPVEYLGINTGEHNLLHCYHCLPTYLILLHFMIWLETCSVCISIFGWPVMRFFKNVTSFTYISRKRVESDLCFAARDLKHLALIRLNPKMLHSAGYCHYNNMFCLVAWNPLRGLLYRIKKILSQNAPYTTLSDREMFSDCSAGQNKTESRLWGKMFRMKHTHIYLQILPSSIS